MAARKPAPDGGAGELGVGRPEVEQRPRSASSRIADDPAALDGRELEGHPRVAARDAASRSSGPEVGGEGLGIGVEAELDAGEVRHRPGRARRGRRRRQRVGRAGGRGRARLPASDCDDRRRHERCDRSSSARRGRTGPDPTGWLPNGSSARASTGTSARRCAGAMRLGQGLEETAERRRERERHAAGRRRPSRSPRSRSVAAGPA